MRISDQTSRHRRIRKPTSTNHSAKPIARYSNPIQKVRIRNWQCERGIGSESRTLTNAMMTSRRQMGVTPAEYRKRYVEIPQRQT